MNRPQQPIKIVFFDIDETLYIKAEERIPNSIVQQVLPALKAKGIIPAIATGRTFGALPKALLPLIGEHGFELFVTINGQHNRYKDQVISQYTLPTARVEEIIGKLTALGIDYAFVTPTEIAASAHDDRIHQALSPIKADYIVDPMHYQQNDVVQMLAFFEEERLAEVQQSGIFGEDLKEIRWHPFSVDILNKHNSKANGIQDVLHHFGFGIENAMAFGDGLNDLEMLSAVGFGVAMGNAEESLKAVADYVTLPIEQDGILVALQKLGVI